MDAIAFESRRRITGFSEITKRSIVVAGHKTSISLETWGWRHFKRIARARGITYAALVGEIDTRRGDNCNLSAAIRRVVVEDLEDAIGELLGPGAQACELLAGRGARLLPPANVMTGAP